MLSNLTEKGLSVLPPYPVISTFGKMSHSKKDMCLVEGTKRHDSLHTHRDCPRLEKKRTLTSRDTCTSLPTAAFTFLLMFVRFVACL